VREPEGALTADLQPLGFRLNFAKHVIFKNKERHFITAAATAGGRQAPRPLVSI